MIHGTLNPAGGAEMFCLNAVKALKERGHEVLLATIEKTDWWRLEAIMPWCQRPDVELSFTRARHLPFQSELGLLEPAMMRQLAGRCDVTVQTHCGTVPIGDILVFNDLPPASVLSDTIAEGNNSSGSKVLRRLYSRPYAAIYRHFVSKVPDDRIFVVSKFVSTVVRESVYKNPITLYPAISTEAFARVRDSKERESSVLTCGRFSEEKNFDLVLDVASKAPDVRFSIVGTVNGDSSRNYYRKIKNRVESEGMANVELAANLPFAKLLKRFGMASIILSTRINEPLGASVIEGMAAGLVPIVHRSGGPWLDSVGVEEKFGYSYCTAEAAASAIQRVIHDNSLRLAIAGRNARRVQMFSKAEFSKRFSCEVERIASTKGKHHAT